MGRPKAAGIGENSGGPATEAEVGMRACVCIHMCMCVHVCMGVHLGSSEVSFHEGQQEKERISPPKAWGSAKQTGNEVPPYTHQELEEEEKTCDDNCILSITVSPVCSKRPGSASVSKNMTNSIVLGEDPGT